MTSAIHICIIILFIILLLSSFDALLKSILSISTVFQDRFLITILIFPITCIGGPGANWPNRRKASHLRTPIRKPCLSEV